jgi:hypothetical protein
VRVGAATAAWKASARRKSMAAFDPATLDRWRALAIVDRDGTTVGTISEFYLDRETGYPTWALVDTGLFGATQTFVPLVHATEISDGLQVPYEKRHIKDTPKIDLHDELSPQEEAELFAHYGVDYDPVADPGSDEDPTASASEDADATESPTDAGEERSGESQAEAGGTAGSPTVAGDEGPGPVRADTGIDGSHVGSGSAVVNADGGSGDRSAAYGIADGSGGDPSVEDGTGAGSETLQQSAGGDGDPGTGQTSEAVPAEPGSVDAAETVHAEMGPAPTEMAEADPARSSSIEAATRDDSASEAVPDEPGTTEPDEAARLDSHRSGSYAGGSDGFESVATPLYPDPARSETAPPDLDPSPERSQAEGHDPDLARTAPVEPGLPGSTAASPYGPGSATIDKAAHSPEAAAEEAPRPPDEAGWAPGAAGSFEEQQPFDRPAGSASDRWREAKLAAERDRIARTAATQPEERSPLERARRRLERLVGVGQDHSDPDELSPDDREAAERARRARLGLDEDDRSR